MSSTTQHYVPAAPPPGDLRIVHWPLSDEPLLSSVAVLAIVAVGWYAGQVTESWLLGVAASSALAIACWRIFIPSSYEITSKGVTPKVWSRGSLIPWRSIARYEITSSGVLLSPFAEATALAGLRGLFIPFGSRRTEILAALQYYLGEPSATS